MAEKVSHLPEIKRLKYSGIKLTRNAQHLYKEYFKILSKRHKDRLEQMETHPLFLDRSTPHCKGISSP